MTSSKQKTLSTPIELALRCDLQGATEALFKLRLQELKNIKRLPLGHEHDVKHLEQQVRVKTRLLQIELSKT